MGWILHYLLVLAVLAYTTNGQTCHPNNIRESDKDASYLNLDIKSDKGTDLDDNSDILRVARPDGSAKASEGIFLTRDDEIEIKSVTGSNVLLSIRAFEAELLKASKATLLLKGAKGTTLYEETVPLTKPSWNTAKFNLGDGIIDVAKIILKFYSPTGEVKVRNIFIIYCIQTGWCPWTKWKACSVTCGGGEQFRDRTCECPNPDPRVFKCPTDGPKSQSQGCNTECCPEPPSWASWKSWGACSATCGDGSRMRSRKCVDSNCPDNTKCKGKKKDIGPCNEGCCPQPPKWGAWSLWGDCSVTCENGIQLRTRKCYDHPCPDSTKCPGERSQVKRCERPCCPSKSAEIRGWTTWSKWSDCSVTCERGTQERTRQCIYYPCPDITYCPGRSSETQYCERPCCPLPPSWTQWTEWSYCSATCGDATRSRSRKCEESVCPDDFVPCSGPKKQTEHCNLHCCEITIDYLNQYGLKVFRKNNKNGNAKKVLRGSGKNIFLIENDDETQYLDIVLDGQYTVFVMGVETLLASYVKVTSMPTAWPPSKEMSSVPVNKQERKAGWFKHRFNMRPDGVGPIDKIRLDFGFPSGELKVRKIFLTVCPV